MPASLEIFRASIVLIGSFNPAIVTPDWLEKYNLLGPEDAELARNSPDIAITHHVTKFETDWCVLQVLPNQFSITSKGAVGPNLMDLAVGIFSLLPHTPVSALGMNFMAHYRMDNEDEYHKVGDVLAPKAPWYEQYDPKTSYAGLESITVRIHPFARGEKNNQTDSKNITLQASAEVPGGIFMMMNDHHDIKNSENTADTNSEQVVKLIGEQWQERSNESMKVFESVLNYALAQ